MCVDEDSSLISDVEGEPLFDENGGLSKPLQGVMDFMVQVQKSKEVVDRAVAVMAAADLIVEWPLRVRIGEEEKPITGLYMVDEAKLNGLEDQLFLGLRKSQSLPVAYAQLLSMANINVLARLAGIREKAPSSAPTMELQLGDDDLIKFT